MPFSCFETTKSFEAKRSESLLLSATVLVYIFVGGQSINHAIFPLLFLLDISLAMCGFLGSPCGGEPTMKNLTQHNDRSTARHLHKLVE